MRINLICPYKEKDQARSLGARWDAAQRVWYIVGVEDLTQFMRWIKPVAQNPSHHKKVKKSGKITTSHRPDMECNCDVLPWDHCPHSEAREEEFDREAQKAMEEMLS